MSNLESKLVRCLEPISIKSDTNFAIDINDIKYELEKITSINYEKVFADSLIVLQEQVKDLRVLGFLILATIKLYKKEGILFAINFYHQFLIKNYEFLKPERMRGKIQAINWLNNPKLPEFLKDVELSAKESDGLQKDIKLLNNKLNELFQGECKSFTILDDWLTNNTIIKKEKPEIIEEKVTPQVQKAQEEGKISISGAKNSLLKIIQFKLDEEDFDLAIKLSRAWAWSNIDIPNHQNYITEIMPPRAQALTVIEKIDITKSPTDSLKIIENIFLENSCKFYLDLQYLSYRAAMAGGYKKVATIIESLTKLLLQNNPTILNLQFNNGLAFASNNIRVWLKDEKKNKFKQGSNSAAVIYQKIQQKLDNYELTAFLYEIENIKQNSLKDKIHILGAKALACVDFKKDDIALLFLEQQYSLLKEKKLKLWLPEMAIEVLQEIYNLVGRLDKKIVSHERTHNLRNRVYEEICLTNPAVGANI